MSPKKKRVVITKDYIKMKLDQNLAGFAFAIGLRMFTPLLSFLQEDCISQELAHFRLIHAYAFRKSQ